MIRQRPFQSVVTVAEIDRQFRQTNAISRAVHGQIGDIDPVIPAMHVERQAADSEPLDQTVGLSISKMPDPHRVTSVGQRVELVHVHRQDFVGVEPVDDQRIRLAAAIEQESGEQSFVQVDCRRVVARTRPDEDVTGEAGERDRNGIRSVSSGTGDTRRQRRRRILNDDVSRRSTARRGEGHCEDVVGVSAVFNHQIPADNTDRRGQERALFEPLDPANLACLRGSISADSPRVGPATGGQGMGNPLAKTAGDQHVVLLFKVRIDAHCDRLAGRTRFGLRTWHRSWIRRARTEAVEARKDVEAATESERVGRIEAQQLLAESCLNFADQNRKDGRLAHAVLWYHRAAELRDDDPEAATINRMRAFQYLEQLSVPVAAWWDRQDLAKRGYFEWPMPRQFFLVPHERFVLQRPRSNISSMVDLWNGQRWAGRQFFCMAVSFDGKLVAVSPEHSRLRKWLAEKNSSKFIGFHEEQLQKLLKARAAEADQKQPKP